MENKKRKPEEMNFTWRLKGLATRKRLGKTREIHVSKAYRHTYDTHFGIKCNSRATSATGCD